MLATLIPGLVSITFRQLSIHRIVALAAEAKLRSIEWGGDVHVPPGDSGAAADARTLCVQNGLAVSAYGSYYRAGATEPAQFEPVLQTACELGAPTIRVWAGDHASAETNPTARQAVVDDLRRISAIAAHHGRTISLEYHPGTLTDSASSTLRLMAEISRGNLRTYWQPPVGLSPGRNLADLQSLLPHLSNIHIFHWKPDIHHRCPLSEGADDWRQYLLKASASGQTHHVSLEFVRHDDPEQFKSDAHSLLQLLDSLGS